MKSIFITLTFMTIFIVGGCDQITTTQPDVSPDILIGKSLTDQNVSDFLNDLKVLPEKSKCKGDDYYYSFTQSGIDLICNNEDRILTVFIYSGDNDHKAYTGTLPHKLRFKDTRSEVIEKIGLAPKAGGGRGGILGRIHIWDIYDLPTHSLHVQYTTNGTIGQITLRTLGSDVE